MGKLVARETTVQLFSYTLQPYLRHDLVLSIFSGVSFVRRVVGVHQAFIILVVMVARSGL